MPCGAITFQNPSQISQQVREGLCWSALGGSHSHPFTRHLAVLALRQNFQLGCRRVRGFALWHHGSSAAADSLKCRQGACLHLFFRLGGSLVSLASAIDPGGSLETSERRSERWEGRLRFPWHVPEITEQQEHSRCTWKTVKEHCWKVKRFCKAERLHQNLT